MINEWFNHPPDLMCETQVPNIGKPFFQNRDVPLGDVLIPFLQIIVFLGGPRFEDGTGFHSAPDIPARPFLKTEPPSKTPFA